MRTKAAALGKKRNPSGRSHVLIGGVSVLPLSADSRLVDVHDLAVQLLLLDFVGLPEGVIGLPFAPDGK